MKQRTEMKADGHGDLLDSILEPFRAVEDLVSGVIYDDHEDEAAAEASGDDAGDDKDTQTKAKVKKAKKDDEDGEDDDRRTRAQTVRIEHLFRQSDRQPRRTKPTADSAAEGEAAEE